MYKCVIHLWFDHLLNPMITNYLPSKVIVTNLSLGMAGVKHTANPIPFAQGRTATICAGRKLNYGT